MSPTRPAPAGATPLVLRAGRLSAFVLASAVALAAARPAPGQEGLWTEASVIGYGGAGVGAGIAACWSCDYAVASAVVLGGLVVGLVAGHRIGSAAESAARRNEWPRPGPLLGARVGTVLGGAALGAGLAALWISNAEGNAEGEDERNLAVLTGLGAAVGVVVEVLAERSLSARVAEARTRPLLAPAPGGGVSLAMRRGVRW